jgi:hypothetical protein
MKKMKSVICVLLGITLFFASLPMVMAEGVKKEFVIDGQLDPWYLHSNDIKDTDFNIYHYWYLDPYLENSFTPYMEDVETHAQVYTAYDSDYVYVYVQVWDDDIVKKEVDSDIDGFDSIEVYFDPDPLSKSDNSLWVVSPFDDEKQGEAYAKMHIGQSGEFVVTTNEIKGLVKPGYQNVALKDYFADIHNVCGFVFDNIPCPEDDFDITSGYGMEIRFPRYDDERGGYCFTVACKNSGTLSYVLATQKAWAYNFLCVTEYSEINPFFNQEFPYGDINGDAKVDAVDALTVLQAAVGKTTFTQKQTLLADVDGNGDIDAGDALQVLKYGVIKIDKFPVEN